MGSCVQSLPSRPEFAAWLNFSKAMLVKGNSLWFVWANASMVRMSLRIVATSTVTVSFF
jgi:hypothetical protein